MNRNVLAAALSLVLSLVVWGLIGCQPAAPDTNRDAARTANANIARETVNPAAIEAELVRLEREWAAANKNRDGEAVKRVLADDAVITYPDGVVGTKADEVQSVESGAITADSWELLEPKVTVLSADAAYITGRSIIKNGKYKDPNAKKPIDISGEYRFTDIYARRNGKWQAVASQTTQIKNPVPAASASPSPTATVPPPPVQASPAPKTSPSKPTP
jgi:ketosteroid isomerase-like protein